MRWLIEWWMTSVHAAFPQRRFHATQALLHGDDFDLDPVLTVSGRSFSDYSEESHFSRFPETVLVENVYSFGD